MARACSCVLNSWQFGTAVLVVRSKRLLQSVIAKSFFFGLQRRDCDGFGEIWNIARIVPLYGLVKNPCPIKTKPSQLVQSRR